MSVAAAILISVYGHWQELPAGSRTVASLVSVALSAGYLTPIVAGIAVVLHGLIWVILDVDTVAVTFIFPLDALALALLGPGAYSIDSYLFGRRVVVLPPP